MPRLSRILPPPRTPPSADPTVLLERDVPVRMRDGIVLRADLYRPRRRGRFPALLLRTPYGKFHTNEFARHVRAGYLVAVVDSRGRHSSGGEFVSFHLAGTVEAEDGFDCVEWLACHPRCNGRVGTFGDSYNGWMQWQTARLRPPHLRAMSARTIPVELQELDWPGSFSAARRLHWWFSTIGADLRRRAGLPPPHVSEDADRRWLENHARQWLWSVPWTRILPGLPASLRKQVAAWFREPSRPAWGLGDAHREIEVPNLDVTGWYDHCNATIGHFTGMRRHARSAIARRHTRLLIGPWNHVLHGARQVGPFDFGEAARVDLTGLEIRWFDFWLKGRRNGIDREPAVKYFLLGAGAWKTSPTWPPPGTRPRTLHLDGGHRGNIRSGRLVARPPRRRTEHAYVYDPLLPMPTLWGPDLFTVPSDRRRLDHRADLCVYRSPPLRRPLTVAGNAEAILHAASSARDTDFFVRLVDEEPGGPALEVSYGFVRARHRHGTDRPAFLVPGRVTEFRIRLRPTACRFAKGHRVRVEVTSSDYPQHDRNHNTGRNEFTDASFRRARQRILHGPRAPSRIVLPVLP